VDFSGKVSSDGQRIISNGTASAHELKLVPAGSPAREAVRVQYEVEHAIAARSGALKKGAIQVGDAVANLTGTYRAVGNKTALQMKFAGSRMPAPDLAGLLPALGIALPAGASLQEGTLDTDLTISGPTDNLTTTGPVNLSNARLGGFSLGSQLKAVAALAGLPGGSDTVIETFASGLRIAKDGTRADDIRLVVAGIGNLSGSGIIRSDQALDFRMTLVLSNTASPIGSLANVLTRGRSASGIPFRIQGTASKPVFIPDLQGIAGGLGGTAAPGSGTQPQQRPQDQLGDALRNIFGR
jgi:hypothetical protein